MIELTVSIKSSDGSYKQKFLIYDDVTMHENDPIVKQCVEEALSITQIEPEEIKVRTLLLME